jgi:hypothetical protein
VYSRSPFDIGARNISGAPSRCAGSSKVSEQTVFVSLKPLASFSVKAAATAVEFNNPTISEIAGIIAGLLQKTIILLLNDINVL